MAKTTPTKKAAPKAAEKLEGTPEANYSDASGTDTAAEEGAKARLETMTPERRRGAPGQVATASEPKKG